MERFLEKLPDFWDVIAFSFCKRYQLISSFALQGFFNHFFCKFIIVDWHNVPLLKKICF